MKQFSGNSTYGFLPAVEPDRVTMKSTAMSLAIATGIAALVGLAAAAVTAVSKAKRRSVLTGMTVTAALLTLAASMAVVAQSTYAKDVSTKWHPAATMENNWLLVAVIAAACSTAMNTMALMNASAAADRQSRTSTHGASKEQTQDEPSPPPEGEDLPGGAS